MSIRPGWRAFGAQRPPAWLGLAVSGIAVGLATAAIYPLSKLAPTVSLSVVYLPGVLLVSAYWGLGMGLLASLLSAAAFNFFHIPPAGQFTVTDRRNWVALIAFMVVAVVVSAMAEVARARTLEAERGRREADLAAGLARELLLGASTIEALGSSARRVAEALAIPSAAIVLGERTGEERRSALALCGQDGEQIATLLVPNELPSETSERLRSQVAPSLAALVAIALRRDALQAEAVETAALRRSDELKTALLRSVSHDLRTPVTAVVAAGHALGTRSLTEEERAELSGAVVEEGERLSALIDKLLDLSRLQAGRAEPRQDELSLEEVLMAARETAGAAASNVPLIIDADVPAIRGDAVQLERAFANLIENARRYSDGQTVSIHARRAGPRVRVYVVDQGPGIPRAEQDRIFEPFYRSPRSRRHSPGGSGLGLAIAKGFVEAGGGRLSLESLPGQGASFIVEIPAERPVEAAA
jgi:two-component system, OmpR family, sensor histidine kinase KdpD